MARGTAPASTIASPWTAIASRSVGSRLSALLVRRIAWPYSFCFIATLAMVVKARAVARVDHQRGLERIVGGEIIARRERRLALLREIRATAARSGRRGAALPPGSASVEVARPSINTRGLNRIILSNQSRRSSTAPSNRATKKPSVPSCPGVSNRPAPSTRPPSKPTSCTPQAEWRPKKASACPAPSRVEDRAGGIDQRPARLDQRRGEVEQFRLQRDDAVEPLGRQPPAPLGIAPPRPRPAARRIDQHDVGLPGEIGEHLRFLARVEQAHCDRPPPRAPRAAPSCDSRWRLVSQAMISALGRRGGDRQRLAPCPGAQVDDRMPARRRRRAR